MSRKTKAKAEPAAYTVGQVAAMLAITDEQVIALIDECGLGAVDISSGNQRRHWRIPIPEFEKFKARRSNLNSEGAR